MPFVPAGALLRAAQNGRYAVGAFNFSNLEILQAIVFAAEAERAPVILQATPGAIRYAGLDYLAALARTAAAKATVPLALHLDHGTDPGLAAQCVQAGFSSVMIDGSKLPLAENIALTRQVVETARRAGVSVEAELGKISGTEDEITVAEQEALFTDPEEARHFVAETGVDALAVAVGTAHGVYRGEPKLDFERLSRIRALTPAPLVLHGSSGVPDGSIREAIARGVQKINIDTDLRLALIGTVRQVLTEKPAEIDPRKVLGPAREAVAAVVRKKIRLFGSAGKA